MMTHQREISANQIGLAQLIDEKKNMVDKCTHTFRPFLFFVKKNMDDTSTLEIFRQKCLLLKILYFEKQKK